MLLKNYLPPLLANAKTFIALNNPTQSQIDSMNNTIQDIVNQCYVSSATWGLASWESTLGIITDITLDIEYRRTVVLAKLRGYGTVTKSMLINLLKSMPSGDSEIIEDAPNSTFTIKFNNYYSIPINIPDILKMVDIVKPAHLAYNYTFTYNWWSLIDSKGLTWDCGKTWDDLRTYEEEI